MLARDAQKWRVGEVRRNGALNHYTDRALRESSSLGATGGSIMQQGGGAISDLLERLELINPPIKVTCSY